ncbi:MAG: hypothetical protein K8T26_07340 [Lentisphaerae bacterium]|nr:hypothetical protein [Lentisphaerota bacterium]
MKPSSVRFLLAASEEIHPPSLANFALVGELALSGEVRRVRRVLPIAIQARAQGLTGILVPSDKGLWGQPLK